MSGFKSFAEAFREAREEFLARIDTPVFDKSRAA